MSNNTEPTFVTLPPGTTLSGLAAIGKALLFFAPFAFVSGCMGGGGDVLPGWYVAYASIWLPHLWPFLAVPVGTLVAMRVLLVNYDEPIAQIRRRSRTTFWTSIASILGLAWAGYFAVGMLDDELLWGFWAMLAADALILAGSILDRMGITWPHRQSEPRPPQPPTPSEHSTPDT